MNVMLLLIVVVPIISAALAAFVARAAKSGGAGRTVLVAGLLVTGGLIIASWSGGASVPDASSGGGLRYLTEWQVAWIPQLGVSFHLAADGFAFVLLSLAVILGIVATIISANDIHESQGFFLFNLGLVLAGVIGVFLAADLIFFFLFWELMIVPMYFLIAVWGSEQRRMASMKFFIFTQASGLVMLVAMLALYAIHGEATGNFTFDMVALSRWSGGGTHVLVFFGFLVAFGVKLPMVPGHSWLPDAHSEAPTSGSILLAGLLLKTGAYGMLRFATGLFAAETRSLAPAFLILGVIGVLYGAVLAVGQTDLKRLVAYTSISHMGFVVLGLFTTSVLGFDGALIIMLSHGFTTSGLFVLAGSVKDRLHTREIARMGGMRSVTPRLAGIGTAFWVFALGLPGTGNFLGEFMVLAALFQVSIALTIIASAGILLAMVYSLRAIARVYNGPTNVPKDLPDFTARETILTAILAVLVVAVGLIPGPVLESVSPAAHSITLAVTSTGADTEALHD